MKTRNGFVSNSSSSSFIVFFKELPKSVEETMQTLWPNKPDGALHLDYYDDVLSYKEAAKIIFEDICKNSHYDLSKKETKADKNSSVFETMKDLLGGLYYVDLYSSSRGFHNDGYLPYLTRDVPTSLQTIIGVNEELKKQYVEASILEDKLYNDLNKQKEIYIESKIGSPPRYKSGYDKLPNGEKAYSDKEIEESQKMNNSWYKERDNLIKSKEYLKKTKSLNDKCSKQRKLTKQLRDKLVENDIKAIKKWFKNHKVCIFNYGDNESQQEAILEHGKTFKNINCIKINQH